MTPSASPPAPPPRPGSPRPRAVVTSNAAAPAMLTIVHGAGGRMGRRVLDLAMQSANIEVVGGIDRPGHPDLGRDLGTLAGREASTVALTSTWPEAIDAADVVIDFSLPTAVPGCIQWCQDNAVPLVVATTGLGQTATRALNQLAELVPVVYAPSMSPAVNLCMRQAVQITRSLCQSMGDVDVEILERHHRFKADAPSGTALRFGELIAEAMTEVTGREVEHVHGRHGETGQRPRHQIGYHAIRTADDPGQHTILWGMMGETIELRVAASSRDGYAAGAIAAAKFVRGGPEGSAIDPGLYDMFDVLGLR